ncbi:YhcH/YjgK/YiaL family protein [Lentisphaerota bacterium WC36G]|nr:YhcH/YjgK/YiaL family protein [Lentisphaerae bacterium WC36]
MIYDKLENLVEYTRFKGFADAMVFLRDSALTKECGVYEIKGKDVIANIIEFDTKDTIDGILENHQEYIDIHTVIEGQERFECYCTDELTAEGKYDPNIDCQFFEYPNFKGVGGNLEPGKFAIFFPQDGHITQLKQIDGEPSRRYKKVIIKIKKY